MDDLLRSLEELENILKKGMESMEDIMIFLNRSVSTGLIFWGLK